MWGRKHWSKEEEQKFEALMLWNYEHTTTITLEEKCSQIRGKDSKRQGKHSLQDS